MKLGYISCTSTHCFKTVGSYHVGLGGKTRLSFTIVVDRDLHPIRSQVVLGDCVLVSAVVFFSGPARLE